MRSRKPVRTTGAVAGASRTDGSTEPTASVRPAKPRVLEGQDTGASKALPLLARKRTPTAPAPVFEIIDDLPRPIPVSRAELEVLEMFLGLALDALLREIEP